MEAKELMIGDWVQFYNESTNKDECARVTSIQDGKFVQTSDCDVYYLEDIYKPIPLTKEILEKNGFNFINYEYPAFYLEGIELMEIENMSGGLYELKLIICIRNVYLHYVHELQHALRLCGINKEIEL